MRFRTLAVALAVTLAPVGVAGAAPTGTTMLLSGPLGAVGPLSGS
jgi:hypothetical protein